MKRDLIRMIGLRKKINMSILMPVKCDSCGIFCSSLDAVATDGGLAFCGSVRSNGCAEKYLQEGENNEYV